MEEPGNSDKAVSKPPTNTLFKYFAKSTVKDKPPPLKPLVSNCLPKEEIVREKDVSPQEVHITEEKEKENGDSKKLIVKMKNKKKKDRKRKNISDEDEDDILCPIEPPTKKQKDSEDQQEQGADVDKCSDVIEVGKVNENEGNSEGSSQLIHKSSLELEEVVSTKTCSIEETPPPPKPDHIKPDSNEKVLSSSSKPVNAISGFFKKVSKEERLQKVEQVNSQLEVKVMVHSSPEDDKVSPEVNKIDSTKDESGRRRKPRKSNVARSEAETTKIEIIEVNEENVEDSKEVVEVEIDHSTDIKEASEKISAKLFSTRRSGSKMKIEEDSENSVNMESLENSPVKNVPLTDVQEPQKEIVKSAFQLLMKKPSREEDLDNSVIIDFEENTPVAMTKEVVTDNKGSKKEIKNSAFDFLMKKPTKKVLSHSHEEITIPAIDKSDSLEVIDKTIESENTVPKQVDSSGAKRSGKLGSETLGAEDMNKKDNFAASDMEEIEELMGLKPDDASILKAKIIGDSNDAEVLNPKEVKKIRGSASAYFVMMNAKKTNLSDSDAVVLSSESVETVTEEVGKEITKTKEVKNNAFSRLMQVSKAIPDLTHDLKKSEPIEIKVNPPSDALIKNMLSVLQSVESESNEDQEDTETKSRRRRKSRRKSRKRVIVHKESSNETSPEREDIAENTDSVVKPVIQSDDEEEPELVNLVEEDCKTVQATSDSEVFEVRCKRSVGKLHLSKFTSGGTGLSILYEDSWYTPNGFESLAGSRAKKYKSSLFVNNKPFSKLLTDRKISTPSRSGRITPQEAEIRKNGTSSPLSRKSKPEKRGKRLRLVSNDSDDEKDVNKDLEEDGANEVSVISGRRGSGRIAKRMEALQEKQRKEEEIESYLQEKFNKETEIKKIGKKQRAEIKKRKVQESSSSPSSDSECEVEKVVVKKKAANLASIFMKGKKSEKEKVTEDPEITAARRAFLMSSAPEILKSQVSKVEEVEDVPGMVFPTKENIHVVQRSAKQLKSPKSRVKLLHGSEEKSPSVRGISTGDLLPQLMVEDEKVNCQEVERNRLSEADVLATVENLAGSGGGVKRLFCSYLERRLEAESFEREARDKKLSVQEVEEKRIRGNRRKSRRSRGGEEDFSNFKAAGDSGLMWTGKYQPRCGSDLVGNKEEVARLKEWLREWVAGRRRRGTTGTTGSESCSDWISETDYSDAEFSSQSGLDNTALIQGPSGVGKTAAVFALAAELGFTVLEVNASSCRSGRQVVAMLQEATQSQLVKKDAAKKTDADKKSKTALILFKDIDIVFDDLDDGFYGAVNTLSQQTKRPIVMTTSNTKWVERGGGKVFKVDPTVFTFTLVAPSLLARHLQVLSLVEGFSVSSSSLLDLSKKVSHVRRAVLHLQLACQSGLVVVPEDQEVDLGLEEEGEEPDLRKWFRHLDGKSRRAGTVVIGRCLGREEEGRGVEYRHQKWWSDLPVKRTEVPTKVPRYPLVDGEGEESQFSRIDPLKNKDFFDSEGSDCDDNNPETSPKQPQEAIVKEVKVCKPKTAEEKDLWRQNQESLSLLSSHLDIVSLLGAREEEGFLADSLAQDLPATHQEEGGEGVVRQEMQNLSGQQVVGRMTSMQLLEPLSVQFEEEEDGICSDVYQEVICSGLVCTQGRVERGEVMSAVRGMARLEEHKRAAAAIGRRGKTRQVHYFAQSEAFLGQAVLDQLCNALLV